MKLHINDKIKELRKGNKWTQEELAERLSVSPQAVSRWETNATFPDIELLPDIASVFEVSVDELLGVNDLLNNDKIKKMINEANSYYDTNEIDKVVSYLEQAKKEYPTNVNITFNLVNALSAFYGEDRTETCERIIKLGTKIIDRLVDINEKCRLYQIMAYTHVELGNLEQAKICASKLPDMEYTSNFVLPSILEGEDKVKCIQENIKNLICTLIMQISYLVNVASYSDKEKITILKKIDALIELMYEKDDYIYTNWLLCGNNINIADIYAKLKDEKNLCLHLSKSINYSKISNKKESKSLLNNVLENDVEKTFGKTFEQNEEYFAWLYDLQNNLFLENMDDLANLMDELYIEQNGLEEQLENLPEELKERDSYANLLEIRIECLENIYNELDLIITEVSSGDEKLSNELIQYIKTLIADME